MAFGWYLIRRKNERKFKKGIEYKTIKSLMRCTILMFGVQWELERNLSESCYITILGLP